MNLYSSAAVLPGLNLGKTFAPHPVWKDSTRLPVKFSPLAKRDAVKIYHHGRRFERKTRTGGGKGCIIRQGVLGLSGLAVLHALLFDFLNYNSGRLDPSYEAIAKAACVSVRTVHRALVRLKKCGILGWVRRCAESYDDRRYVLSQETNAYGVAPPGQWRGYDAPPDPPPLDREAWGAHPRRPPELEQAMGDRRHGLPTGSALAPLADALGRLDARRRGS